jgi:hypothetical protein
MKASLWIACLLLATGVHAADVVDPSTLNGKVLFGYQGWFDCPGPATPANRWSHWSRGVPSPETLAIDMYPDLSEFRPEQLCAVPGMTVGDRPAYLYSAANPDVVRRHFQWMKEYGLDGVLVQRFVTDIAGRRAGGDVVLKNVMAAAAASGRVFAVEYDISGADPVKYFDQLREDWTYLTDVLKVTAHPSYLRHNGKPVLSVWGMGLNEDRHPPRNPQEAKTVIDWFRARVTFIAGTPSRWRTLNADSQTDPAWADAYRAADVIQPWTVGRYRDVAGADRWKRDVLEGDVALTKDRKQIYMPVIFPGFSWKNLKKDEGNKIPRLRGEFLWRQAYNAKIAGATVLKIAMFDEVNEGTAMFKIAAKRQDAPEQGFWLTLDADGADLPSDYYLRLGYAITRLFHGELAPAAQMPAIKK